MPTQTIEELEEALKLDSSNFPTKYEQAIQVLKTVIEDIKKINLLQSLITRNKALEKFLDSTVSKSCQLCGLLEAYPYLREPYLKFLETLDYNPDAHLQMLKKEVTIYFQQFQISNLYINFYEKLTGELFSAVMGLNIDNKLNNKELSYEIKAHQYGARKRNLKCCYC